MEVICRRENSTVRPDMTFSLQAICYYDAVVRKGSNSGTTSVG